MIFVQEPTAWKEMRDDILEEYENKKKEVMVEWADGRIGTGTIPQNGLEITTPIEDVNLKLNIEQRWDPNIDGSPYEIIVEELKNEE